MTIYATYYIRRGKLLYPFRYLTNDEILTALGTPENERDYEVIHINPYEV